MRRLFSKIQPTKSETRKMNKMYLVVVCVLVGVVITLTYLITITKQRETDKCFSPKVKSTLKRNVPR